MQLNQLASNDYVKLLCYGTSGTGKTCLAAGFPGPIEYWDFDHKVSSAAKFYANDVERLKSIDVYQFAQLPKAERIAEWEKRAKFVEDCRKKGALPFKTLVLDSLTTFSGMLLDDYIHRSQKGIKRMLADIPAMQDYQLLDKHLTHIITGLLSLDCNVVMLGHLDLVKDEATGALIRQPLMAGKFAAKLPIYFEEVYVTRLDASGKHILQTRADNTYSIIRSQRNLAKEIPATFKAIINKA